MTNHSKDLTELIWETRFSKPFKISSTLVSSLNFTTTKCLNPEVTINLTSLASHTYIHLCWSILYRGWRFLRICARVNVYVWCVNVHVCVFLCACVWTIMLFAVIDFNVQSSVYFWHYLYVWWLFVSENYIFLCLVSICFFNRVFDNLHVLSDYKMYFQFLVRIFRVWIVLTLCAFGLMSVFSFTKKR